MTVILNRRGTYYTQPRAYLTDIYRTKIDELKIARPTRGRVSFNQDRLHKRDAILEVMNPHKLRPLRDYVMLELVEVDAMGTQRVIPLGHFTTVPGTIQMSPVTGITGTIEGADLTYSLEQATLPAAYVVPPGVDTGAAARDAFMDYGVPPDMLDIPDSGIETTEEVRYEEGDTWLALGNGLLEKGGMYTAWTDGYGVLMSRKYFNIDEAEPHILFGQRSDIRIVGNLTGQPDWTRVRNRVTYRKIMPGQPPVAGSWTIDDKSNPLHPENWGQASGSRHPKIHGITIPDNDLPDDPLVGKLVAMLKARADLAQRASYYLPLQVQTMIDDHPHGHQLIGMTATYDDLNWSGTWWRRTWAVDLAGPAAVMDMGVNRSISVQ